MKLYVTRHGETAWNKENKVCGRTELPLTDKGREQARETGEKLKGIHFDRVLCSPMGRTRETAEIILEGRGMEVEHHMALIEQDYGECEGVSRFDGGFFGYKKNFAAGYPGGESQMMLAKRVYRFLDELRARCPEETVLIVCHGGVCRVIESYFKPLSNGEFLRFGMGNCEVREYDVPGLEKNEQAVKFYGTQICKDCAEALSLFYEKGFTGFEYKDIGLSTANLREFLALRDERAEFAEIKKEGRIGVPCFVLGDGSVCFDPEAVLKL